MASRRTKTVKTIAKPSKRPPPTTTIKISRRVRRYIEGNAKPFESVNDTLRRLFQLKGAHLNKEDQIPLTTTIKVTRDVIDHVKGSSRGGESRDMTIERLLKIESDNGNVEPKEEVSAS